MNHAQMGAYRRPARRLYPSSGAATQWRHGSAPRRYTPDRISGGRRRAGLGRCGAGVAVTRKRLTILIGLCTLVIGATLGLLSAGPSGFARVLLAGRPAASPLSYREVDPGALQPIFGRDLVIDSSEATPEGIQRVVAKVAGEDASSTLRLNVFTSDAAAASSLPLAAMPRTRMIPIHPSGQRSTSPG